MKTNLLIVSANSKNKCDYKIIQNDILKTNLEDLQNITLLNGYSLSISQGSVNTVNLIFTNPAFNLNFYFNVNELFFESHFGMFYTHILI